MDILLLLLTVAGVHLAALASPGPDFFFITQVAVNHSRKDALKAVIGITLGVVVWAAVALLGLHILVERVAWIRGVLYFAGGAYLSYLGFLLLRGALSAPVMVGEHKSRRALSREKLLLKGLLTNLANPKALIYFGSVFILFVGEGVSSGARGAIFTLVVGETFLWFSLVALLFSIPALKAAYQKAGRYLDGLAGLFFLGFGLNLIYQVFWG